MAGLKGRIVALAAAVALLLSFGAFAATPTHAAGPSNQFQYPQVMGVNGSDMSSVQMHLNNSQRLELIEERVPWTEDGTSAEAVASWRYDGANRDYAQVEGRYCKNKSGGDVFMATGAPADSALTCSSS